MADGEGAVGAGGGMRVSQGGGLAPTRPRLVAVAGMGLAYVWREGGFGHDGCYWLGGVIA